MAKQDSETNNLFCEALKVDCGTLNTKELDLGTETNGEKKNKKYRKITNITTKFSNKLGGFITKVAMLSWCAPYIPPVLLIIISIPMLCGFILAKRSDNYIREFISEDMNAPDIVDGIDIVFRSSNSNGNFETNSSTLTRNVMNAQLEIIRSVQSIYDGIINAAALILYDITDDPFTLNSPVERLQNNPEALSLFDSVVYAPTSGLVIGTGAARMEFPTATSGVIDTIINIIDELKDSVSGGIKIGYMYEGAINSALDESLFINIILCLVSGVLSLLIFVLIGSSCFKHGLKGASFSVGLVTVTVVLLCLSCGIGISFYAGYYSNPMIYYAVPCCISIGLASVLFILQTYKRLKKQEKEEMEKDDKLKDIDDNIVTEAKTEPKNYISLLRESYRTSISGTTIITLISTTSFACLAASDIPVIKDVGIYIGFASFLIYTSIIFVLSPYILFDTKRKAMQKFDICCCLPKPHFERKYEVSCDLDSYEINSMESNPDINNMKIVAVSNNEENDSNKDQNIVENFDGVRLKVEFETKKGEINQNHTKAEKNYDKMKLEHLERQKRPPLSRRKLIVGSVLGSIVLFILFAAPIICISLGLFPSNTYSINNSLPDESEVNIFIVGSTEDRWTMLPLLSIGIILVTLAFTNIVVALISIITIALVIMMSLTIIRALNLQAGGFGLVGVASAVPLVVFSCVEGGLMAHEVEGENRPFIRATKTIKKAVPLCLTMFFVFAFAFIPQFFSKIGVIQLSSSCALITFLVGLVYELFFASPLAALCSKLFIAPKQDFKKYYSELDFSQITKFYGTNTAKVVD